MSDPTGTVAAPLPAIARVDSREGRARLDALIAELAPERILVGRPAAALRAAGASRPAPRGPSRSACAPAWTPPVELVDERLTTVEAERRRRESGARADLDSLAACVLLESYLARER